MGLLPDGDALGPSSEPRTPRGGARQRERSFTRKEAIRTPAFWTLAVVMALGVFGTPGFQAHWIPYLREQGFNPGLAATALTAYGVFGISSRFFWAYLTSRFSIRRVFIAQASATSLTPLLLLAVDNNALMFIWAALTGITIVAFWQLQALIAVTYFGREHIGAIRGLMWPLSTVAGAASPLVLGVLRDWHESYTLSFGLVMVVWASCSILIFFTRPPSSGDEAGEDS